jgi:phosphatidate cytidylyltransferase
MHESLQLRMVFGGIFAVLLIASAVGAVLRWRAPGGRSSPTIDNLNARINAWWVMVLVLAVAFVAGKAGIITLFAFVSFMALREFVSLVYTRRGDHRALALAFFVFLPLQYVLVAMEWYGLYSILIPVYAFLLLPIFAALGNDTQRFLERSAKLSYALLICVYCVSYVPALLALRIPDSDGRLLIVWLVLVVESSDVLQYVWGKLAGRHAVAPALSPSKTWEGLVGGVLSSVALGSALWWITPFTLWQAALIALVVDSMGFLGGLVMSAIKRDRGVKDWGQMIEGHGGMLDRLDSVIFAAPIFFHITRYWWTP